jgi:hypothetical protein
VNVLLITYTLKNRFKDYSPFYNIIKANCSEWWHYFDTTWIVVTKHPAHDFANLLYPHMEDSDRLLVIKVQKDYQGWLDKPAWDWLNAKYFP